MNNDLLRRIDSAIGEQPDWEEIEKKKKRTISQIDAALAEPEPDWKALEVKRKTYLKTPLGQQEFIQNNPDMAGAIAGKGAISRREFERATGIKTSNRGEREAFLQGVKTYASDALRAGGSVAQKAVRGVVGAVESIPNMFINAANTVPEAFAPEEQVDIVRQMKEQAGADSQQIPQIPNIPEPSYAENIPGANIVKIIGDVVQGTEQMLAEFYMTGKAVPSGVSVTEKFIVSPLMRGAKVLNETNPKLAQVVAYIAKTSPAVMETSKTFAARQLAFGEDKSPEAIAKAAMNGAIVGGVFEMPKLPRTIIAGIYGGAGEEDIINAMVNGLSFAAMAWAGGEKPFKRINFEQMKGAKIDYTKAFEDAMAKGDYKNAADSFLRLTGKDRATVARKFKREGKIDILQRFMGNAPSGEQESAAIFNKQQPLGEFRPPAIRGNAPTQGGLSNVREELGKKGAMAEGAQEGIAGQTGETVGIGDVDKAGLGGREGGSVAEVELNDKTPWDVVKEEARKAGVKLGGKKDQIIDKILEARSRAKGTESVSTRSSETANTLVAGKVEATPAETMGKDEWIKSHGIPVYHGTAGDGTFTTRIETGHQRIDETAIFFTDSKELAREYAESASNNWQYDKASGGTIPVDAKVIEAYLDIKNPYIVDLRQQWNKGIGGNYQDLKYAIEYAKEKGYDGVIAQNMYDVPKMGSKTGWNTVHVVFDKSQIKTRGQLESEWERQQQTETTSEPPVERGETPEPSAFNKNNEILSIQEAVNLPHNIFQNWEYVKGGSAEGLADTAEARMLRGELDDYSRNSILGRISDLYRTPQSAEEIIKNVEERGDSITKEEADVIVQRTKEHNDKVDKAYQRVEQLRKEGKTAPEVAKEPWQMTREEYYPKPEYGVIANKLSIAIKDKDFSALNFVKQQGDKQFIFNAAEHLLNNSNFLNRYTKLLINKVKAVRREANKQGNIRTPETHKEAIQQALSEGKPVPPEVLADYPDLAQQKPAGVEKTKWDKKKAKEFRDGITQGRRLEFPDTTLNRKTKTYQKQLDKLAYQEQDFLNSDPVLNLNQGDELISKTRQKYLLVEIYHQAKPRPIIVLQNKDGRHMQKSVWEFLKLNLHPTGARGKINESAPMAKRGGVGTRRSMKIADSSEGITDYVESQKNNNVPVEKSEAEVWAFEKKGINVYDSEKVIPEENIAVGDKIEWIGEKFTAQLDKNENIELQNDIKIKLKQGDELRGAEFIEQAPIDFDIQETERKAIKGDMVGMTPKEILQSGEEQKLKVGEGFAAPVKVTQSTNKLLPNIKAGSRVQIGKNAYGTVVGFDDSGKWMFIEESDNPIDLTKTAVTSAGNVQPDMLRDVKGGAAEKARAEAEERPETTQFGSGLSLPALERSPARSDIVPENVQIPNKDVEKRWQDKHGVKPETKIDKLRSAGVAAFHKATRTTEFLPPTGEYDFARESIRLFKDVPQTASDEVNRNIAAIIDPMGKKQFALFERKVFIDNLLNAVKNGQPLRFGFESIEEIEAYQKQLDALIVQVPEVQQSLKYRKDIVRELVDEGIENGVLPEDTITDNYIHQMVISKIYDDRLIQSVGAKTVKRGFQKKRVTGAESFGEEYDYNTSYIEAESKWMTDLRIEIAKKKFQKAINKRYGKLEDYKHRALTMNFENYNKAVLSDEQYKEWFKLYEQEGVEKYMKEDPEIEEKMKAALGDKYMTWQRLMKKEGTHDIFVPGPKHSYFVAFTLPQRLIAEFQETLGKEIGVTEDDLRKVLAIGNPKDLMVLPKELVAQLDSMTQELPPAIARVLKEMQKDWKVWTLLNPFRAFSYMVRNITGDIDPAITAAPGIIKYAAGKGTLKELWNYYSGKLALSETIKDCRDLGVLGSAFTSANIPDLKDLAVFGRFFESKEGSIERLPKEYFKTVKKYNEFREGVLRVAAYKYYLDALNNGDTINYGGAKKSTVLNLQKEFGNKVAAAHLARNLLGDYTDMTVMGNWLRGYMIPFWAWNEINIKRFPRLIANAYEYGKETGTQRGTAKVTASVALSTSLRTALVLSRMASYYAIFWLFNNLFFRDEEESLGNYDRANPHIITGKNPDGSFNVFRNVGATGDVAEWLGINDLIALYPQYKEGQISGKDVLKEMAKAPVNKFVQGLRPDIKAAQELLTGESLFPDAFNSRTVPRGEVIPGVFGLADEYRAIKGAIAKEGSRAKPNYLQRKITGVVDPRRNALYEMYDLRTKFLKKQGIDTPDFHGISQFKNMREAAMSDNYEAFKEARAAYMAKTQKDDPYKSFKSSISNIDPVKNRLSDKNEKKFEKEFLNDIQRKHLNIARDYANQLEVKMWMYWRQAAKDAGSTEGEENAKQDMGLMGNRLAEPKPLKKDKIEKWEKSKQESLEWFISRGISQAEAEPEFKKRLFEKIKEPKTRGAYIARFQREFKKPE